MAPPKINPPDLKWLGDPAVRAYAITSIAETGLPEARQYLSMLTPAALGPDTGGLLAAALATGSRIAALKSIDDPSAQIVFFEGVLRDQSKLPGIWAAKAGPSTNSATGGVSNLYLSSRAPSRRSTAEKARAYPNFVTRGFGLCGATQTGLARSRRSLMVPEIPINN